MADSFLGIFDSLSDDIDGLFDMAKDFIGIDSSGTSSAAGDFFGKKVTGALFGSGGSGLDSKKVDINSLNSGLERITRPSAQNLAGRSKETSPAKFTDPRTVEAEWTNRLFKFANMTKLVNNTAGSIPK